MADGDGNLGHSSKKCWFLSAEKCWKLIAEKYWKMLAVYMTFNVFEMGTEEAV